MPNTISSPIKKMMRDPARANELHFNVKESQDSYSKEEECNHQDTC
jgi:hypothetical protein